MEPTKQDQVGSLKISQDVIAAIAKTAAVEIEGVDSLAEPHSNLRGFFSGSIGRKPIEIVLTDGFAEIDMRLNLVFGAKIGEVCKAVQNSVKDNVQTMTGIVVSKVNIIVANIAFPQTAGGAAEKAGK